MLNYENILMLDVLKNDHLLIVFLYDFLLFS